MESTFLLHKPVIYGSALANNLFLGLLLLHIVTAAIAPISAIASFTARKGNHSHKRSGSIFAISMIVVVLTGSILDVVRLCFFVAENHTKYAGYTMPSTYPARLGFIFVGLCILYLLREVTPPSVFSRPRQNTSPLIVPGLLVITGLTLTGIITFRLSPWTGALWMIWTFILIVIVMARTTTSTSNSREKDIIRHRFGTSCLAAFGWWGAAQGFGPAIALLITGDDLSTQPYLGNQPGPFSIAFVLFLVGWAPFFILAGYLVHRFSKLRHVANSPHT